MSAATRQASQEVWRHHEASLGTAITDATIGETRLIAFEPVHDARMELTGQLSNLPEPLRKLLAMVEPTRFALRWRAANQRTQSWSSNTPHSGLLW
ncbi:MAG: hypothetical protein QOG69_3141 [Actinomycetota bacterium]|nr:hypothetical protein [Actinomycetota bacterium]